MITEDVPSKRERLGSIFQPVISGGADVATYTRQGVVDSSTAEAVKFIGGTAIDAYRGYEEAKVQNNVEQVVNDLFTRKAVEAESPLPVDARFEGATQQAYLLAEQSLDPESDPAVKDMGFSLAKLGRAKEIGAINEYEFKARVQSAVKAGIDRMPGRADTFRKIANDVLGDNSATIDMLFAREKEAADQAKAAAQLQKEYIGRVSTWAQKDPARLTESDLRDYEIDAAARQRELELKRAEAGQVKSREEAIRNVSSTAASRLITITKDVYDNINGTQIKGKSFAEYKIEAGSEQAAIDALANDEVALVDFQKRLQASVTNARLEIDNLYTVEGKRYGLRPTEYQADREAQLKILDDLNTAVSGDVDKGQLATLFKILNTQNKTRVESTLIAAPAVAMARTLGFSKELLSTYFTPKGKELVGTLYGSSLAKDLDTVFGGTNPALATETVDTVNAVSEGRVGLADVAKVSPRTARIAHAQGRNHIRNLKESGFIKDNPASFEKQKNTFVTFSSAILDTIDPNDPNSVKALHTDFGDQRYQDLLKELDAPQREQITANLTSKFDNIIGTKDERITILGRIEAAKNQFMKEEASGGRVPESVTTPIPKVTIENGKLVSNVASNKLASSIGDLVLGAQRGLYQDHANSVAQLNRLLEDKYRVLSTFEKIGPYSDFLKDFYNNNIKGGAGESTGDTAVQGSAVINFEDL